MDILWIMNTMTTSTNTARTWDQVVLAEQCLPVAVDAYLAGDRIEAVAILTEADMSAQCAAALIQASVDAIEDKIKAEAQLRADNERLDRIEYNISCFMEERGWSYERAEREALRLG